MSIQKRGVSILLANASTSFSFDCGSVHFVVLNGNKPMPGATGNAAVHGAVEGSELAWLKADLAAQPKGKSIVVG